MKEQTAKQYAVEAAKYLMANPNGILEREMSRIFRSNVINNLSLIGDFVGAKFMTRRTHGDVFRVMRLR